MNIKAAWIAYTTIVYREIIRIFRIWTQTLLPSAVTTTLYFVIFGHVIGQRIGLMDGYSYIEYIAPGLIMMSIVTNSYSSSVTAFFSARFQRYIEEILVTPMSNMVIIFGFMTGAMIRGLLVGLIVGVISLLFTHLHLYHFMITFSVALLASALFAFGGIINAIFAKRFDDIALVPTFVLTPLTYLGGVFYSISLLPPFWRGVSFLNPIVYMVEAFRYGLLGVGISLQTLLFSYAILILFGIVLYSIAWMLLSKGIGVRG